MAVMLPAVEEPIGVQQAQQMGTDTEEPTGNVVRERTKVTVQQVINLGK